MEMRNRKKKKNIVSYVRVQIIKCKLFVLLNSNISTFLTHFTHANGCHEFLNSIGDKERKNQKVLK